METKLAIRHGDLWIYRVEERKEQPTKSGEELTVALGEATGHHHTLYATSPQAIIEGFDDARYFRVIGDTVELRHQEHDCLKITPGTYEIVYERERDPFLNAIRKVVD